MAMSDANAVFLSSYVLGVPTSISVGSFVGANMSKIKSDNVNYVSVVKEDAISHEYFHGLIYPKEFNKMSDQLLMDLFDDGRGYFKNENYKQDKFTFNLKEQQVITVPLKWNRPDGGTTGKTIKENPFISFENLDNLIDIKQDSENIYIKNNGNKTKEIYFVDSAINEYEYNIVLGDVNNQTIKLKNEKTNNKNNQNYQNLSVFLGLSLMFLTLVGGKVFRNIKNNSNNKKIM